MQIAKRRGDAYKECVATDHSTFPLQPIVLCRSLCPTRSGNWRHGWYILQGWYSQSIGFPPKAQVAWDQKQMEQDVQDWKLWKLCLSINATLVGRQSEGSLSEAVPANWRIDALHHLYLNFGHKVPNRLDSWLSPCKEELGLKNKLKQVEVRTVRTKKHFFWFVWSRDFGQRQSCELERQHGSRRRLDVWAWRVWPPSLAAVGYWDRCCSKSWKFSLTMWETQQWNSETVVVKW